VAGPDTEQSGMRSRRLLSTATVVVALAALAACGNRDPAESAASGAAVVRLGALVPLTGRSSYSGEAMAKGARLAVAEANASGGVLGRRIELLVEDDACDPGTAVTAAGILVAQDIAVSVGGYCSSATVPTMRIFRTAGIPMIVARSNSTDLLGPRYDSVFLLSGTVVAEAQFAVGWMVRLGGRRLAIIQDGTSFPATLAEATANAARGSGRLTVIDELRLSQGAPSYNRIAEQVIAGRADIVYYTGYYAEANQLIKDLRTRGFAGKIVVGDGATDGPLLRDLTAAHRENVYGTSLLFPEFMPELADWSERYRAAYGSAPGPSTVEAYDAVTVAVDAIRRAGGTGHEAVRKAISTTDMPALSGPMSFNGDGTRAVPKFLMLRAEGDGFALETADG
jgi:branched-chain amino acid transport system substrate-binding protein